MAYDPTKPHEDNAVRAVDLPAMRGNFEELAPIYSGIRHGGSTAPNGWIVGIEFDLPTGTTPASTSGMAVLSVDTLSAMQLHVYDGSAYRRAWNTRTSGSAAYLQVTQDPVADLDVATKAYVDAGGGGGSLSGLSDVQDALAPASGEVLVFDGTEWVADSVSAAAAGALDDIGDVDAPSPASGEVLTWNSGTSKWEAQAPQGGSTSFLLYSGELTSGAPTLTVSGWDQTKRSMRVQAWLVPASGVSADIMMRINAVTTSGYATVLIDDAPPGAVSITFDGFATSGALLARTGSYASHLGMGSYDPYPMVELTIPDYSGTRFAKTWRGQGFGFSLQGDADAEVHMYTLAGMCRTTSGVTSLTFLLTNGNDIASGSRVVVEVY